jgi:hypothetical protein
MNTQFREYAEHYSVLAMILAVGILGIILFRMDLLVEQVVVWALSAMYVLWGITHHILRRDLTGFIVLEYLLIGLIAGFVVTAVIGQK